jgi:lipopolysaccharide transport system ATP-binding protein
MADNIVIEVDGLGKRYRLGASAGKTSGSLREALTQKYLRPNYWLKALEAPDRATEAARDFWALKDVSFSVNQGQVVGVVGRNGAGKSTLLKILSRITEPTTGRIRLRGRIGSLLEVGTGFHGELSGRENIFLNGAILGMRRAEIERKFDEIVAFAEVEKFLDTPVKFYSSGMYVRLAFAVAAHLEPEILIVDEVLAVGDQEFQRKCLGKIQSVTRNEGRTVLFVSHNLAAVRQLCTHGVFLQNGRVVCADNAQEVIRRYLQSTEQMQGQSAYRHIRGDGEVQITRIRFVSNDNADVYAIFDPIRINIDFEFRDAPQTIEFFVLIYADDGDCIAASFQKDSDSVVEPKGMTGQVSLSFKNTFAPGRYTVSAGIFSVGRSFLDWVEFAESFTVESSFSNGQRFDGRFGRLTLPAEWRVSPQ